MGGDLKVEHENNNFKAGLTNLAGKESFSLNMLKMFKIEVMLVFSHITAK